MKLKTRTVLKKLNNTPGVEFADGLYRVKDSARYPADKRWLKASDSA